MAAFTSFRPLQANGSTVILYALQIVKRCLLANRLHNFVCESVPSAVLEDIKTQISVATAIRGTGDVNDGLLSEVYERGSLFARRESASSAPTTTSERHSSRICDRTRRHRRVCLVGRGKDMFVVVLRNAKQKHFCEGIDCRFSYEYIGEKADVVGYCLWCDSDKMQKAMERHQNRVKEGLQFFYGNDEDVFRMALTRLPVEYRTYWPLKALGLPWQFHSEENMKAALKKKNSYRYRTFIKALRAVFATDERLYKFVVAVLIPLYNGRFQADDDAAKLRQISFVWPRPSQSG